MFALAQLFIVLEKELAQADWAEQRNFSPEKYTCPSKGAMKSESTFL